MLNIDINYNIGSLTDLLPDPTVVATLTQAVNSTSSRVTSRNAESYSLSGTDYPNNPNNLIMLIIIISAAVIVDAGGCFVVY